MQIDEKLLTLVEGTVYNFVSFMCFCSKQFFCYVFLHTEFKVYQCKTEPLPFYSLDSLTFKWSLVFKVCT